MEQDSILVLHTEAVPIKIKLFKRLSCYAEQNSLGDLL